MGDREELAAEVQRLRAENDALDQQVKLLVKSEQRQYRLGTVIQRQLDQIRALGDFALSMSYAHDVHEIRRGAVRILTDTFDLDLACVVQFGSTSDRALLTRMESSQVTERELERLPAGLLEVLAKSGTGFAGCVVAGDDCEPAARLFAALDLPLRDAAGDGGFVVCQLLRDGDGAVIGLLLARTPNAGRRSFYRQPLDTSQVPYLQLLARHIEGAMQATEMTRRLLDRGAELAATNERLTSSLRSLEDAQQKLVQAQKMEAIGRLAGGIAHDFNNLLTVVLSHAELLQESVATDADSRENVAAIVDAGKRASRITNQLLAFSRRQQHAPMTLDLGEHIRRMAEILRRLIGEHIDLELRADPSTGHIRADASQIEQIVFNLVINARDAMPEGGTLTIEVRAARPDEREAGVETAILMVNDDGAGMDRATLEQIFEPFFTTKLPGHGTGLGLATVYGLVEQNGGTIAVASEPGAGSRFTIRFPKVAADAQGPPPPSPTAARSSAATILLVEDEASIRSVVTRILQSAGYSVLTATDGIEGLRLARAGSEPIGLLLTDVVMPRMSGVDLWRELRRLQPNAQVLFMSGYVFDEIRVPPDAARLQKPFAAAELLHAVRERLTTPGPGNGAGITQRVR